MASRGVAAAATTASTSAAAKAAARAPATPTPLLSSLSSLPNPPDSSLSSHSNPLPSSLSSLASPSQASSSSSLRSILWFRKGLRLHDNPALHAACNGACHVFPVFVLDPWFLAPDPLAPSPGSARVGLNRIRFLLESLVDLDEGLRRRGSRLLLLQGDPVNLFPNLFRQWNVRQLCFEYDTEPYALKRDAAVKEAAREAGVEVRTPVSHTIWEPADIIKKNKGKPPLTYQSFCKVLGPAPLPVPDAPTTLPGAFWGEMDALMRAEEEARSTGKHGNGLNAEVAGAGHSPIRVLQRVPTLADLGYPATVDDESAIERRPPFRGGETAGLQRLEDMMSRTRWVADFEKPKGDPSAFLNPATTVLSPYLKFGCVSARLMYQRIHAVYGSVKKHSNPPVSLEGQLLWREFFYTAAFGTPNFDRMHGSSICKQIAWNRDEELLRRWRDAQTGFPWIDAIMVQLREWGWMHHLARHSVACFLTRGDLFVHWELGRDVFDRLLLDGDWAINNGNWLWLSASAFFAQFHRVYSPITFGKKYDPAGKFIRHFLPVLKDYPSQYIYEPWSAPLSVQKAANCIIGKDYPFPVVDHAEASKACKDQMGRAYQASKGGPDAVAAVTAVPFVPPTSHLAHGSRPQAVRPPGRTVGLSSAPDVGKEGSPSSAAGVSADAATDAADDVASNTAPGSSDQPRAKKTAALTTKRQRQQSLDEFGGRKKKST